MIPWFKVIHSQQRNVRAHLSTVVTVRVWCIVVRPLMQMVVLPTMRAAMEIPKMRGRVVACVFLEHIHDCAVTRFGT